MTLSFIFVGWALGLGEVYLAGGADMQERLISLAYPFGLITKLRDSCTTALTRGYEPQI